MARADYSRDFRSISKGEAKREELAPALRPSSVTQRRTKYDGPVKNRGEDARGNANVSREELADFQRQYGADMTLRDLLNADKTGNLPKPKAPAGPRRDMAAEAKGAETLERMKSLPRTRSNEEMRDEAKGRTLAALGAAATLAGGPLARMAMGRAASEGAKRITPMLATSRNAGTGKFRDTQGSLKESTEAAMKSRSGPEMGAGAKPGPGRVEPMLSTSRASDSGKFRKSDVSLKEATEAAKKGRTEPTFKKGGSVRGGGCETRSKKTRYV